MLNNVIVTMLREMLARLAHEQWSGWMEYLFGKGTLNDDGTWTMPVEFVQRWTRQMRTPYTELSESEQDSDRKQADKFMAVIESSAAGIAEVFIGRPEPV